MTSSNDDHESISRSIGIPSSLDAETQAWLLTNASFTIAFMSAAVKARWQLSPDDPRRQALHLLERRRFESVGRLYAIPILFAILWAAAIVL